jgi:hypothetical protein
VSAHDNERPGRRGRKVDGCTIAAEASAVDHARRVRDRYTRKPIPHIGSGDSRRHRRLPPSEPLEPGPFWHVPLPVPIGPYLDRKPPAQRGRFSFKWVCAATAGRATAASAPASADRRAALPPRGGGGRRPPAPGRGPRSAPPLGTRAGRRPRTRPTSARSRRPGRPSPRSALRQRSRRPRTRQRYRTQSGENGRTRSRRTRSLREIRLTRVHDVRVRQHVDKRRPA